MCFIKLNHHFTIRWRLITKMALLTEIVQDVNGILESGDDSTLVEVTHISKDDLGYLQKAFSEYFITTDTVVSAKDRTVSYTLHVSNNPRRVQHA